MPETSAQDIGSRPRMKIADRDIGERDRTKDTDKTHLTTGANSDKENVYTTFTVTEPQSRNDHQLEQCQPKQCELQST
jgi:hypothetical protein